MENPLILSIKEKAKRYDEAIKIARKIISCEGVAAPKDWTIPEVIFPELRENEDDKSKKWILEYLYDGLRKCDEQFKGQFKAAIAWLEKQSDKPQGKTALEAIKEKKVDNANKVKPNFHEGDWVVYNNDICKIVKREEGCNKLVTAFGIEKELVNERNLSTAHLWTIQYARDGDVLVFKTNIEGIIICKSPTDYDTRSYCRLVSDNLINKEESGWDSTLLVPATKEQRDTLMKAIADAGYEFDFEKKELKKINHNTFLQKCFNAEYERGKNDALQTKSEEDNVNKVELKFNIGDWVIITTETDEHTVEIIDISYFRDAHPMYITSEGRWFGNGTKARLWNINYAKDGDILCYDDEVFIYKNFDNSIGYYACWDSKNIHLNSFYLLTLEEMKTIKPATKEQRKELLRHLSNAGYIFDIINKEILPKND